jgi:Rap1a immunity proteins
MSRHGAARGESGRGRTPEGLPAAATLAYLCPHHAHPSAYSSDRLHTGYGETAMTVVAGAAVEANAVADLACDNSLVVAREEWQMKNTTIAVCAALFASAPNKSTAQDSKMFLMGTDFLSACSRADPDWVGFCHGYVQAVYDGMRRPGEDICAPPGTSRADIVGAVVRQLTAIPDLRNLRAYSVVYAILLKAFPCR